MNKTIYMLLALVCMLGLAGCVDAEFKAGNESFQEDAAKWPFRPESMRFHPFTTTQQDTDAGRYYIDAHVELLDQVSDQTKGIGTIRFELYETPAQASTDPLANPADYVWTMNLNTVNNNREKYDPIMRLYKFRLALSSNLTQNPYTLKAMFVDDRGIKLQTETNVTGYTAPPVDELDEEDVVPEIAEAETQPAE